jgi:hypothetical protein
MKTAWRTLFIIFLVGLAFLGAYLFRAFLLDNFVRPLALVFWMVWRLLGSVDQATYWTLLVAVPPVYVFVRMFRHLLTENVSDSSIRPYNTPAAIDFWRTFILSTAGEKTAVNLLKRNMIEMLANMYTTSQPDIPYWQVYEGLESRQIPLPGHVYAFLFPPDPARGRPPVWKFFYNLRRSPAVWVRQWTGRAEAEYFRSLDELLAFMESSLEINHDN